MGVLVRVGPRVLPLLNGRTTRLIAEVPRTETAGQPISLVELHAATPSPIDSEVLKGRRASEAAIVSAAVNPIPDRARRGAAEPAVALVRPVGQVALTR